MKKLVSVIGSLIVGMNFGAVSTNAAMGGSVNFSDEGKRFSEIISKYESDCTTNEDWTLLESISKKSKAQRKLYIVVRDLAKQVGVLNFEAKAEGYSKLSKTLRKWLSMGFAIFCYRVPLTLEKKGRWPFAREYYTLLENENNVNRVKRFLPSFLDKLCAYLDSLDSNDTDKKNKLKTEMRNLLEKLPKELSELIVAALEIYKIEL